MRTFKTGTTKIDVVAQISRDALELDQLVLTRFQGSAAIANTAFRVGRALLRQTIGRIRDSLSGHIPELTGFFAKCAEAAKCADRPCEQSNFGLKDCPGWASAAGFSFCRKKSLVLGYRQTSPMKGLHARSSGSACARDGGRLTALSGF